MKNLSLIAMLVVFSASVHGQFYVKNGATLTIGSSSTLYWDGDLVVDGDIDGNGMFELTANAQTISGVGGINNIRISSGADVTPANSLTIGNALDVTASSSITVPSNLYIVVNGPLSNAGTFNVENNGSLVQTMGSTLTGSGVFNVKRQGSNSSAVYNYWSSPITSASVPGSSVYQWNPHTSTQDYADDAFDPGWVAFGGSMVPGAGYASTGGGLATFSGTANNADVNRSLVHYAHDLSLPVGTPFNLVGNPYPCAVSALDLVTLNTDVNGSLYFWNDDLSGGTNYSHTDYAVWNLTGTLNPLNINSSAGTGAGGTPNGFISSCQGFMIRALGPGAVLNFDNSMRVTGPNNQFFKLEAEPSRMWLSIEGDDEFNEILVAMIDDATDGEDRLYDAVKVRGNSMIALSAVNEEMDYAIMAFPPPMVEKTIPLNLFVAQNGTYNFHSNTIEGYDGYDIYLEDRSTFTYYPLVEGTQVPFQLTSGNHNERFYLHIGSELVTGVRDIHKPAMQAWMYDGLLSVTTRNLEGKGLVELLDMAGKQVWVANSSNVSERITVDLGHLSRGVYVVRLTTPSESFSDRVIR
jgi:hypothetical protein